MSAQDIDRLRGGYDRFNRQDLSFAHELLDQDIDWHEPEWFAAPIGGDYHGPDEVVEKVFQTIPRYYDGFRLETHHFHDAGERYFVTGDFVVRLKGGSEDLRVPFVHEWRWRDGKAIAMRNYIDATELVRAVGQRRAA